MKYNFGKLDLTCCGHLLGKRQNVVVDFELESVLLHIGIWAILPNVVRPRASYSGDRGSNPSPEKGYLD
jgi:hypothetical protein